jgi:hypothetical protein
MIYTADKLFIVVTGVGQCAYDVLDESPGGQPHRFCNVVPGDIAWDQCECGQLAQTITNVVPSEDGTSAAPDVRQTKCGPAFTLAEVTLSLTRCVPGVDNNGHGPKCNQLLEAARILEIDRYLVRQAVTCCLLNLRNTYEITTFTVGAAQSVGPQGMCAGFDLTYKFAVGGICCE